MMRGQIWLRIYLCFSININKEEMKMKEKWSVIINAVLTAITSIISALTVSSCAMA